MIVRGARFDGADFDDLRAKETEARRALLAQERLESLRYEKRLNLCPIAC
jgi:hypothetical protein